MISHSKYGFVFVAIPKTATSSMQARLFRLGTGHEHKQKSHLVKYHNAQHYNIQEYREILGDELDSRFKFAFVRNPWDKLVSSFTRECSNWRNTAMPRTWILDSEKFQEWAEMALEPELRAINQRYPRYVGRSPRHTAEPQLDMITDAQGAIAVDFIGRFENVVSDFEKVLVKIDQIHQLPPRKYWVLRDLNGSHGATEHYSYYYNDELIEKVRTVYAKDIERFGYVYVQR